MDIVKSLEDTEKCEDKKKNVYYPPKNDHNITIYN